MDDPDRLDEYSRRFIEEATSLGADPAKAEQAAHESQAMFEEAKRRADERPRMTRAELRERTRLLRIGSELDQLIAERLPAKPAPMTDGEKALWDLLEGASFSSDASAHQLGISASTVRHHVTNLRRKGYVVENLDGEYYRPDAPP